MTEIAIIIPVLARPQNASRVVDSILASTDLAQVFFVATRDDDDEIAAITATGQVCWLTDWPAGQGDFARKSNLGYRLSAEWGHGLVLLAADDLSFHSGWAEAVLEAAASYDCGVIGTNDRANPSVKAGQHSTHPVVRRCYIDQRGGVVGEPGTVYFEGYDHQWTDVELIQTARARGCYHHCNEAVVQHHHPLYDRRVASDPTYVKGQARGSADRALYESRRALWERETVPA